MHKTKKAFTLIELLVAMAIIAVLLGLSIFGISTAQRILRDNERRAAVQDISSALNLYFATNSTYPTTLTGSQNTITVGTQAVPLKGAARYIATGNSTADTTGYCYSKGADGYTIGAMLEDTTWFTALSTSSIITCTRF